MTIRVEAKPLKEPLGAGTPGATVVVEPILAGQITWSLALMESPGGHFLTLKLLRALLSGKPAVTIPVPTFLIHHPSAGPIVVDTGLHPSIATSGEENFGKLAARFGKPSLRPGEDLPAQLRKRGIDPSEVPTVLMTHMHLDHTSAVSEFPNSIFVISNPEWKAATSGSRPLVNGYRRAHFDYAFDYRTVDFDRGDVDSYSTFGRTFDLLGDGSIRLAFTPGHSAGHVSIIAHLNDRDFIIGGDAMYTYRQLQGDAPLPPRPFDAHNFRRSLQELRLFRREFPQAVITPGHDPSFYEQLEARYE
jgi:N-acyl homoserine lactone hydrolase